MYLSQKYWEKFCILFLFKKNNNISLDTLKKILIDNGAKAHTILDDNIKDKKLINSLRKKHESIVKFVDESHKHNNEFILFRNVLNALKCNLDISYWRGELDKIYPAENCSNYVFLSHAYEDRAFTFALFRLLYFNKIYLYVDWMHNGKINDGAELKRKISKELTKSSQLILLLSPSMELNIDKSHYIRPMCSWETGNFYRKDWEEKYYINLYNENPASIQLLHGFKLFKGVNSLFKIFGEDLSS